MSPTMSPTIARMRRRQLMPDLPPPEGLLLVDKPAGFTSHDVVAKVRWLASTRKVGHAGTLDPMATGVLVLGVGKATKLLTFLVGCDKGYAATIRLGVATVTDDAEGEPTSSQGAADLTALPDDALHARLAEVIAQLTGDIIQIPSSVSAIKVNGVRAYAKVRGGEDVTLAGRPVTVSRFEVMGLRRATTVDGVPVVDLDVEVDVSSGTYVRALARDLGDLLATGGHLTSLRRSRVGSFTVEQCHRLSDLEAARASGHGIPLVPLADAARAALPSRVLSPEEVTAVSHGRPILSSALAAPAVAAFAEDGRLVAILDETRPRAGSHVVFTPGAS